MWFALQVASSAVDGRDWKRFLLIDKKMINKNIFSINTFIDGGKSVLAENMFSLGLVVYCRENFIFSLRKADLII